MLKQLIKYKWYLGVILALIIVEPSINSVLNFWLQRLFNSAVPGADKLHILRLLTIGFLLWMLKRIVIYSSGILKARFICNAKQDIKHKLFVTLFELDTSNISDIASSGEYISLFTNDITILETRFYNQIISLISGIFSLFILGTSFIILNSKLAVAIIMFGAISMLVPVAFSKSLNEKNLFYSNSISKFTQKMKEYMVAYPTIKNYSIEQVIIEKFDAINQETEDTKFNAEFLLTLANNAGQLLAWFMQFIGVGFGVILVIKGEIMVGTVIAAQSFASDLASPLQNIIININSIRSVKEIVKKFNHLSKAEEKCKINNNISNNESEILNKLVQNKYDIVFDDLLLEIMGKIIINHFTFTFQSGKKYLIVGLNGSGKSSLFKALKKWFSGCKGRIFINDIDISNLENNQISNIISYLNENVSLFSGSIKENISLFRDKNPEVFAKAISDAQVKLDLNRQINSEGNNISSGEQRRIEIARSLLEHVKVLIFDEVVSTLDIETAYEIEKLALNFNDKTVIFISHNFSGKLIRKYDEILVMDNGTLVAHGSYEELLEKSKYFQKICEIKFGD